MTWTLLTAVVLVWIATELAGGSTDPGVLLKFGAMFGPRIAAGEYWRLFAAMFLHAGITHLAFNGFALLIFGLQVERLFGHLRFAAIYLLAGLAGSVVSFIFNPAGVAVGASGAIFGVLGALVAFFVTHRDLLGDMGRQSLTGLLVLAAINLFIGIVTPQIDNFAHIGGFGAGFALGMVLGPEYRPVISFFREVRQFTDENPFASRWWVVPIAVSVLAVGTAVGTVNNPLGATIRHLKQAEQLLEQQEHELALKEVALAIESDPTYGGSYLVRAKVLADLGDTRNALNDLGTARYLGLIGDDQKEAVALTVALMRGLGSRAR